MMNYQGQFTVQGGSTGDSGGSESNNPPNPFAIEIKADDLCYIDSETARVLELVENNVDVSNKKHSLYGYLNEFTCTTSGARMLKVGIMRPLCHLQTIEHRLDIIEFLVNRVDTLSNISNHIKRFGLNIDLDKIVQVIINLLRNHSETLQMAERRLEALTTIETLMSEVVGLITALESVSDQPMLYIYKTALEDPAFMEILDLIHDVIETEFKNSRGKRSKMFRIKQGVESLFDIARNTYTDAITGLEQYVHELNKEDGLSWKLNHSETRGYFLSLAADKIPKDVQLPPKYIRVNRTRSVITCVTQEMMHSNVRANLSYENSMKLANQILRNVLASISEHMSAIYKLVDVVATLDLVTSFAKLVVQSNGRLVRPRFMANETMIRGARHPTLEMALAMEDKKVVPNDIFLKVNDKNVMLITGPNMGGKSIFLKQAALIQIMAQLGCYVPADSAYMKIMNRIVARSGTSDDIESTCSSFMWEMKGIASGLQEDASKPGESVLYIVDEVGRGTTIDDGAAYSFAIAEELAHRINCFTIFATHFDQVFTLCELYRNIGACHFEYQYDDSNELGEKATMKLTHKLANGLSLKDHYGIRLAEACGLPDEILQVAKKDLEPVKEIE